MPSCDHTGTPRHLSSSTTSGSARLTRARIFASVRPRQSPSSAILASIDLEADGVDLRLVMAPTLPAGQRAESPLHAVRWLSYLIVARVARRREASMTSIGGSISSGARATNRDPRTAARRTKWPARLAALAASYTIAGGCLTLVGWVANVERLTDWKADGISMFPNTAIAAALAGVAVL